jgi:hypothetical protein
MVIVPLRGEHPVLVATEKTTVPLPVPLPPDVTVIQPSLLEAVHAQQLCEAVTATLPVPPVEVKLWLVGLIEKVQLPASCVTVNVWPAMVIVPLRVVHAVLAAIE